MKIPTVLLLLFSLFIFKTEKVWSQFSISEYAKMIKNFQYNEAKDYTNHFCKQDDLKKEALQFSTVLFEAGQNTQRKITVINKKNTSIPFLINLLTRGYYEIYKNKSAQQSFIFFEEAYFLSKKINQPELIKLSLLGILQVYNFEIELNHKEYLQYLEEFKQIGTDDADQYLYEINKINFKYQDINISSFPEDFFSKIDSIILPFTGSHPFWADYYSAKGVFYETKKNYDKAIKYHQKAINIIKQRPFLKYIKFRSLIRLSEIYNQKKKYDSAYYFIEQATKSIDSSDITRSNYYLNIYASKTNYNRKLYKKAYEQLYKTKELELTLNYKKTTQEINELNVKYQTTKKEKQLLIEKQEKIKNRNIAFSLGGGLIGVSIIGFLLFKNTKRKQRIAEQQKELEIKKTEKILKEQEINTINAMVLGQEKERKRLAEDLHDSVGAILSAARLQFEHLKKHRGKLNNEEELFTKTGKLLEDAYQEIRSMAHTKNSGVMANKGLLPAIKKLANNASVSGKITIEVVDFGLEQRLNNSLEITIFRIIQELITNIIKHAHASEATISLTLIENTLHITVEDNGKGFSLSTLSTKTGLGLSSIEKRVEHLGGSFEIDSTPNNGTTIFIEIPI